MYRYFLILVMLVICMIYKLFIVDNMKIRRIIYRKINRYNILLTMELLISIFVAVFSMLFALMVFIYTDIYTTKLILAIPMILLMLIANISVIFFIMVVIFGLHSVIDGRNVFAKVRFSYKDEQCIGISTMNALLISFFEGVALAIIFQQEYKFIILGMIIFLLYKMNITKDIHVLLMSGALVASILLSSYTVNYYAGFLGMLLYILLVNILMLFKE